MRPSYSGFQSYEYKHRLWVSSNVWVWIVAAKIFNNEVINIVAFDQENTVCVKHYLSINILVLQHTYLQHTGVMKHKNLYNPAGIIDQYNIR